MKKNYQTPALQVVTIQNAIMQTGSVQKISGNTDISLGGGSDEAARVKGEMWNED